MIVKVRRHRTHRTALPEYNAYRDTGCHLHPRCLECPLPECYYVTQRPYETPARLERKERVRELRRQGRTAQEIADALGISRRQAFRLVKAA